MHLSPQNGRQGERGGVLIMVVFWLPVIVVLLAFVVDAANWWEHKRHLQAQADAAALAGGDAISLSFCNNTAIVNETRKYAGADATTPTGTYNDQVGGTLPSKLHVLVNSSKYWNEGGTNFSDGTQPCDTPSDGSGLHVDVKITEDSNTALQFFSPVLSLFGSDVLSPTINAHARVQIKQATLFAGNAPIGVVDVSPRSGAVIFYNEDAGPSSNPIDVRRLTNVGGSGGYGYWNNSADPASVLIPTVSGTSTSAHVGAVIAFSSSGPPTGPSIDISGTVAQICSRALVDCYYATSGTVQNGLVHIQGFQPAPASMTNDDAPRVGSVALDNAVGCGDADYAYFFYNSSNCTVRLTAKIYISTGRVPADEQFTAFGGSCGSKGCGLSYVSTSGLTQTWQATIPIPANSGPQPLSLGWEITTNTIGGQSCSKAGSNPCKGSFGTVQRAFSGSDVTSGPIRYARLLEGGAPASDSFQQGSTHPLAVSVGVAGQLATNKNDPPISLRTAGSQNGAINCDPNKTFRDQIATGCGPTYAIAPNATCPLGEQTNNQANWTPANPPGPWHCVVTETGNTLGPFTQGIQQRILNGSNTCPAAFTPPYASPLSAPYVPGGDYWQWFGSKDFNPTDPRIVQLFMVPFGSFQSTGQAIYPIVNVGEFYITGWGGNSNNNNDPCKQLDGSPADPAAPGYLTGHFIKRTSAFTSGGGGTVTCDLTSFTPCTPVLTD